MKVRFVIKEQDENKSVQSPEEVNIKRDNLKSQIQTELTDLNLTTVTPEQLEGLLNQIKIIKGEGERPLAEKKGRENCFADEKYKTFKGKSKCIQRTKGLSKDRADAYTASVLRDIGELPGKKK
jgi:sRNA-binding carbon storage regulator CsrA